MRARIVFAAIFAQSGARTARPPAGRAALRVWIAAFRLLSHSFCHDLSIFANILLLEVREEVKDPPFDVRKSRHPVYCFRCHERRDRFP